MAIVSSIIALFLFKMKKVVLFLSLYAGFLLIGVSKAKGQYHEFPLMPNRVKTQVAGNIGVVSAGFGKEFLNGRLNSSLIIGYVPKFVGKTEIVTFSQKNTFRGRNFETVALKQFYPTVGFSINMESGNNSFLILPDRYPKGYYSTNAITFGLFSGIVYQGKVWEGSKIERLEYFAEVGTLAMYVYYSMESKKYFNPDIFSLAIGVNINLTN